MPETVTFGLFEVAVLVRVIWSVGFADGSGRGVGDGLAVGMGVAVGVEVGALPPKRMGPFATVLTSYAAVVAEAKVMIRQDRSRTIESMPVSFGLAFIESTMWVLFYTRVLPVGCIYNFAISHRPEKCLITEQVLWMRCGLVGASFFD